MPQFNALPNEVVAVPGLPAAEKFIDFLNSSFSLQKEDVITVSATQFENRLVRETSGIRLEVAELRSEMRTEIAEVHMEIAELRAETRTAIAEVHAEIARTHTHIAELRSEMKADFASVQKDIAGLHGQISIQTRWILAGLAVAVTLYPIITKLVSRLLP